MLCVKQHIVLVVIFLFLIQGYTQTKTLVSQFTWEVNATTANIGPDATSISSSAAIKSDGNNGTYGLNPGLPKKDINMYLPGYLFDYAGIEVSIDFQRDESQGEFISRGQDFIFGMGSGRLYVRYRVEDNTGSYTTEIGSNIYKIPDDNKFRTYTFYYLPDSGIARVLVDNVVIWENITIAEKPMYWTANNDIIVGKNMDGAGRNRSVFDNLNIYGIAFKPSILPIELLSFEGKIVENEVLLSWTTQTELNNDYFTIERSIDAMTFEPVNTITGNGTSSIKHDYKLFDPNPYDGVNYYRLKQTDYNGAFSYSTLIAVTFDEVTDRVTSVYPNPSKMNRSVSITGLIEKQDYIVHFINTKGEITKQLSINSSDFGETTIDLRAMEEGLYIIKLYQEDNGKTVTQKLLVNN